MPPKSTPMTITLYNLESEVVATHTRLFVPWKILKRAVTLSKRISISGDLEDLKEEDMDELAALVVEVFGNKFSVEELNEGADVGEMVTVLNTIIGKAVGNMPNPTPPGK